MNCIIIDDEPLARAELQALIGDVSDLDIAGQFPNAPTALDFLKHTKIDLIFLDIEMPMVTGLEFAGQVSSQTLIIFTTAYPHYALKSYELDAIDYLLKPISKERLRTAIDKAITYKKLLTGHPEENTFESNTKEFLVIKVDRKFHKIRFSEIKFIEGLKDYVVIYTTKAKLITAMNLKTIHQKIPPELFLRVSKSYVVNQQYIESFDHQTVYMSDGEIPLGEAYKKDFFLKYAHMTPGKDG